MWAAFCNGPAAADFERVPFASRAPGSTTLDAHLAIPTGPGPHPTVVMMHGCGGLVDSKGRPTSRYRAWAETLTSAGHAAVMVDSYTPRGFPESWTQRLPIKRAEDRAADDVGAADFVRHDTRFDGGRMALIGWSNGSCAVLTTMAEAYGDDRPLKAAIALPGKSAWCPHVPLHVLIGALDDWTPAAACTKLAAQTRPTAAAPLCVVVYPGAHHGFDTPKSPVRYRETVLNSSKPGGCCGAHVGTQEDSRLKAIDEVLTVLGETVRPVRP